MRESMTRLSGFPEIDAGKTSLKVYVERHAYSKMRGWCMAAPGECSGMGLVEFNQEERIFYVREVYFPKQYCSGAYTEIDDRALGKLNFKLRNKATGPLWVRFWWHTHADMGVFWSGTDDNNAMQLARFSDDWALSIVINKAGHYRGRVDFMRPIPVTVDNLDVFLIPNTRKVKRKRNFKSDINRWVLPLDAMPDYQKAVPRVIEGTIVSSDITQAVSQKLEKVECTPAPTPTYSYGPSDSTPWWAQERYKGYQVPGKDKHFNWCGRDKDNYVAFCDVCQKELAEDNAKKTEAKKEETKQDEAPPATQGEFSNIGGAIVSTEKAQAIEGCSCPHTGSWHECECKNECNFCEDIMNSVAGFYQC